MQQTFTAGAGLLKSVVSLFTLIFCFSFIPQVHAAGGSTSGDAEQLAEYDMYLAPNVSLGFGSYDLEELDKGTFNPAEFGGRLGFKIGHILIGGEYNEGFIISKSEKLPKVTDANRIRYPELDGARHQTWGWSLGYTVSRVALWYTYLGWNKIKQNSEELSLGYNHAYEGDGHRIDAMIRVYGPVYFGGFYRVQRFDRYSSTHSSDIAIHAPMDYKLTSADYGASLTLMLPFSKGLEKIMKK